MVRVYIQVTSRLILTLMYIPSSLEVIKKRAGKSSFGSSFFTSVGGGERVNSDHAEPLSQVRSARSENTSANNANYNSDKNFSSFGKNKVN